MTKAQQFKRDSAIASSSLNGRKKSLKRFRDELRSRPKRPSDIAQESELRAARDGRLVELDKKPTGS